LSVVALWAPGQNRSDDNSIQLPANRAVPAGMFREAARYRTDCNDGAFGTVVGVSGSYEAGRST